MNFTMAHTDSPLTFYLVEKHCPAKNKPVQLLGNYGEKFPSFHATLVGFHESYDLLKFMLEERWLYWNKKRSLVKKIKT